MISDSRQVLGLLMKEDEMDSSCVCVCGRRVTRAGL